MRFAGDGATGLAIQQTEMAALLAEQDIVFDAEMRREVQLLIDHRDAGLAGLLRTGGGVGLAEKGHLAFVGSMGAAEDFHQRAFAGAVFADQGEDFAGAGFKLNAAQRFGGTKALGDVLHLKDY